MVQEVISGAMAAADAVAVAAVAADSEAARRKERAEHKRQRKRHRDRGSHNKRKNLRRSEGRKARARTRAQMGPVLSQLSHLSINSRQVVELRLSKQARPPLTDTARCRHVHVHVLLMGSVPLDLSCQVSDTPKIFSQSEQAAPKEKAIEVP